MVPFSNIHGKTMTLKPTIKRKQELLGFYANLFGYLSREYLLCVCICVSLRELWSQWWTQNPKKSLLKA